MQVKVTTVGNSVGIVFPKDILTHLNVVQGDNLYITATDSGIELSPYDSEVSEQIHIAKKIMKNNTDVLSLLSK